MSSKYLELGIVRKPNLLLEVYRVLKILGVTSEARPIALKPFYSTFLISKTNFFSFSLTFLSSSKVCRITELFLPSSFNKLCLKNFKDKSFHQKIFIFYCLLLGLFSISFWCETMFVWNILLHFQSFCRRKSVGNVRFETIIFMRGRKIKFSDLSI